MSRRDNAAASSTTIRRNTEDLTSSRHQIRDPTLPLPASIPTTAREHVQFVDRKTKCRSGVEGCLNYVYNSEEQTFCERTCSSWCKIIVYSIMYFILLITYAMIFLYASLLIIKSYGDFSAVDSSGKLSDKLIFVKNAVGITATPASVGMDGRALIWYKYDDEKEYHKYVRAIDELLSSRNKTSELVKALGPCGEMPYGYGTQPCVILRINKQLNWAGKPLSMNSTLTQIAPDEVQKWVRSGKQMLWVHCDGVDPHDQEHLGVITYHPYPPGIDPSLYPMDLTTTGPLLAVQFSNFTRGISLSVVCKLWYELGPSSVYFTLHVEPAESEQMKLSRKKP